MLLHALHAANAGYAVVISSEETDVLVISLAFKTFIATTMFIKTTKQSRTTSADVSKVVQVVGGQVCRALPGFHTFTGCDSVSAFFGQGKVKALKLLSQNRSFVQEIGMHWQLEEELAKISNYLLHSRLFCARQEKINSNQLPPCVDCLKLHAQRANYQAAIWRRSLQPSPEVPTPVDHGWLLDGEGGLSIKWMTGSSSNSPSRIFVLYLH